MLGVSCVLLSYLLSMTLFHRSVDSLRLNTEYLDQVVLEESRLQQARPGEEKVSGQQARPGEEKVSGQQVRPGEEKVSGQLTAKLLLLDHLAGLENDVIEPKRKRSFTGSNTPLDRLSISTMDPKGAKQRKVVELSRRRASVPIDRIGAGRLPSGRG